MRRRSGTAVAGFATVVLFGGSVLPATRWAAAVHAGELRAAAPRTHEVSIREFRFEPRALTVAAGDTIRWVNHDPVPHTATARDSTWDSGEIPAGAERRTVVGAGDSDYFCIYHPTMTGSLDVRRPDSE